MTRDMELMRKICAAIQAKQNLRLEVIAIEGYEEWVVQRHVEVLLHHGLVEATVSHPLDLDFPLIMVKDLTMDGHDFAGSIGNEDVWSQMRSAFTAKQMIELPLQVIKSTAIAATEAWAMHKLGLK